MSEADRRPDIAAIRAAAERIAPHTHHTPVATSRTLDTLVGASLFCKCENLQRGGAFKIRGASNAVLLADRSSLERGFATHSSGNHGAALALAASLRGAVAHVVMPVDAARPKRAAVAAYGGIINDCMASLSSRDTVLRDVVARTGATVVHPYDDHRVIAGQGTVALELLEAVPDLDLLLVPLGGGGLLSGCLIAARALRPGLEVIGVEPAAADDAWQSLRAGRRITLDAPRTVADGLRASVGPRTFAIIRDLVDDVVRVSDDAIIEAMRLIWGRMKLVVEPSAAIALAALIDGPLEGAGRRVGLVLTGGNVDLDSLPY